MHKSTIFLFSICALCSCNKTDIDNVRFHRERSIYQSERFLNEEKPHNTPKVHQYEQLHSLIPNKKLDEDLNFKVSLKFKKKEEQSWALPNIQNSNEESIFTLKPKKTDSTIKIQLKKRN